MDKKAIGRYLLVLSLVVLITFAFVYINNFTGYFSFFPKLSTDSNKINLSVPPTPPNQPSSGPGSDNYSYGGITTTHLSTTTTYGNMTYTIIEPSNPRPSSAPVFVFMMGNFFPMSSSVSYLTYKSFYDHLAKKGYIIIHPDNNYGNSQIVPPNTTINDCQNILGQIINAALKELNNGTKHVKPASDKNGMLIAFGGHSYGGFIAQSLADQSKKLGLPTPRALVLFDTSDRGVVKSNISDPLDVGNTIFPETWQNIPSSTLVLQFKTEDSLMNYYGVDSFPYTQKWVWLDADIRRMFVNVSNSNYSFLYIPRDDHGTPTLESDHFAIIGVPPRLQNITNVLLKYVGKIVYPLDLSHMFAVDAVDYYGLWKPTEAFLDYSLKGKTEQKKYFFETDDKNSLRFMGIWSDGKPVRNITSKCDLSTWCDWFDNTKPFAPVPSDPSNILLSGAPKIVFPAGVNNTSILVLNLGPATIPIVITNVSFGGKNGNSFQFKDPVTINPPTNILYFIPKSKGVNTGYLEIQYTVNGTKNTVRRDLEGISPD